MYQGAFGTYDLPGVFLLKLWKEAGKPLYPVSVNLSRERLYEEELITHLVSIVDESGIPHHLIDFELTESATYDNTEHMLGVLSQLWEKGFQISMDDFGTGYSSLSLLTRMPLLCKEDQVFNFFLNTY